MNFYLFILISYSLLFLPFAFNTVINKNNKIFDREYCPLKEKAKLIYDSNLGQTTLNIRSKENKSIYVYESGAMTYKQYFHFTSKGIYLAKTESKALFLSTSAYYKRSILRLPFPLIIGQKWNWKGYEYFSKDDSSGLTISGEAIDEEEINVPAGKFDALKVETKIQYSNGEIEKLNEWYAPNIGIIKIEAIGKGSGFAGIIRKIFGLERITFELKQIKD